MTLDPYLDEFFKDIGGYYDDKLKMNLKQEIIEDFCTKFLKLEESDKGSSKDIKEYLIREKEENEEEFYKYIYKEITSGNAVWNYERNEYIQCNKCNKNIQREGS